MLRLSDEDIETFMQLYRDKYGEDLPAADARNAATKVLAMALAIVQHKQSLVDDSQQDI